VKAVLATRELTREEKTSLLQKISGYVAKCTACPLHSSRTNPVPGEGNPDAKIMFVGEAPGRDEDLQGRPFVGRAGKRLDVWIRDYLGMKREDVFIANTLKCRPPGNRTPTEEEMAACYPFLLAQMLVIRPRVIVALGKTAAADILPIRVKPSTSMKSLREGNPYHIAGAYVVVTYHPAAILRTPRYEEAVRQDFKKIKQLLV